MRDSVGQNLCQSRILGHDYNISRVLSKAFCLLEDRIQVPRPFYISCHSNKWPRLLGRLYVSSEVVTLEVDIEKARVRERQAVNVT